MKVRFILLAVLAGLFLIVALPVGIAFTFFVGLYYLVSHKRANRPNPDDSKQAEPVETEEPNPDPNPDFNKLFNDSDYIKEQENLR